MPLIPRVVTFVPLFALVSNTGLLGTLPGLFLPFLATPVGVFLMRVHPPRRVQEGIATTGIT